MKKIFSIALAATLLAAGCQKTEVIGLDDSKTGPAMTFSTEMKKITKVVGTPSAGATGLNDNLYAQGFSIWAFADYDLTNATNVQDDAKKPFYRAYDNMVDWFVDYEPATETTSAKWNPGKEFYWPGTGKDLRFFAVSATRKNSTVQGKTDLKYTVEIENGIGAQGGLDSDDITAKVTIKDFIVDEIGENKGPNEDLMVANFVKQNQNDEKQVTLNFNHTLSKVQFLFTTTPDSYDSNNNPVYSSTVTVNSISVDPLETKGTLVVEGSFGEALSSYTWHLASVNPLSGEVDNKYVKRFTKSSVTPQLTKDPLIYDTWLMLPQSIEGKKITINYTIDQRSFDVIFNLNGNRTDLTGWGRNQYIKYTIDISPNKIKFDAKTNPWDEYDSDPNKTGNQGVDMGN